MSFASAEVDVVVRHSEAGCREPLCRPGVHHHGGVDAAEGAALEHEDLTAAAFLGGSAEHADGEPEFVRHRGQGQSGPHRRGRDDVVPAGVADGGQRVVLGAHGDHQFPFSGPRLECRRQVIDALVHGKAARTECLRHGSSGGSLPEAQLRCGVDRVAQCNELVQMPIDDCGGSPLGR